MDILGQLKNRLIELDQKCKNTLKIVNNLNEVVELKIELLGKKGSFNNIKENIITYNLQRELFKTFQLYMKSVEHNIEQKILSLSQQQQTQNIGLPIYQSVGSVHPITITKNLVKSILIAQGLQEFESNEIDSEENCFDKLNIDTKHPCRNSFQSFFLENGQILSPHTSNSQIHLFNLKLKQYKHFVIGKVFRRDNDATHTPMFHQVEVFYIDKNVTLKYMVNFVKKFLRSFFKEYFQVRFRTSYFPFTEPSVEVDIWSKERNSWLEVGGCGLIHPQVFTLNNYPEKPGFAFGFGIERLCMLKYNITDIRKLYSMLPMVNSNIINTRSCK